MHKSSHTSAAIAAIMGELLGDQTIKVGTQGFDAALDWARELGDQRAWALEDCRHVPRAFERFLLWPLTKQHTMNARPIMRAAVARPQLCQALRERRPCEKTRHGRSAPMPSRCVGAGPDDAWRADPRGQAAGAAPAPSHADNVLLVVASPGSRCAAGETRTIAGRSTTMRVVSQVDHELAATSVKAC